MLAPEYTRWCDRLGLTPLHHRKQWEWVFILEVLDAHGMLRAGRRGLGFGVGIEPIVPYAAAQGATVVATDLPAEHSEADRWRDRGEHAGALTDLNADGLCPADRFRANVSFRAVDMRDVPDDLGGFDFVWSSCAMEHLGSLDAGLEFFRRQLECLAPGGLGVHTTEYNVEPEGETLENELIVLYQRPHLEALTYEMRARGHRMRATFATGTRPEDLHVDVEPFTNTHIRTRTLGFDHTSFGLVVRRGS
jgi:SAM-dependent methyltransferase